MFGCGSVAVVSRGWRLLVLSLMSSVVTALIGPGVYIPPGVMTSSIMSIVSRIVGVIVLPGYIGLCCGVELFRHFV